MPNFRERVQRAVDETIRALANTKSTEDPAATGAKRSRTPRVIDSASKRHGGMKRRYDRISINQAALILFNGGQDEVTCVVRDVSPGGAGLSVANTVDIPDRFILAVKSEEEGRACLVRWRKSNELGVLFDIEPVHWMTATGVMLMYLSMMMGMEIFLLPFFEGQRTVYFLLAVMPAAVIGALMILCRLNRLSYFRLATTPIVHSLMLRVVDRTPKASP
jgi:hypothetical protein